MDRQVPRVDRYVTDFLLELRSEEIPARMQAGARAELETLFRANLKATGVTHGAITVWSTPRRLALIVRDLPQATQAVREELKGPKVGAPAQAIEGFCKKAGLSPDRLEDRGGTWFAAIERPGRSTHEVLTWAVAAIVRTFAWPKSMRWGAASLSSESARWVRPLSGIVAIFGNELVEVTAAGVPSGYTTRGHRFHAPGEITIGGAHDYAEKLRACHVIVDHAERETLIRSGAQLAASSAGLTLIGDEGLVIENAGLTEWPIPLLGRFDAEYLEVPPEVIQLTARTNQKYFVCSDAGGRLANAFVCTANIAARDGGAAIVDGNRKVLAARLSDARFFWEQDRKKTLAQHAEGLARITFHEKLGTVADKVERVAKLARWLVEEGIVKPSPLVPHAANSRDIPHSPTLSPEGEREKLADTSHLADLAEQAARLCKADLVTEMVGEFPELQGLMGGYYAAAEGLDPQVSAAIRDHYKPVGQGDDVPTATVTVAVSLADKLDTLASFFGAAMPPTGSKDPFALRRSALGVISMITTNELHLSLAKTLGNAQRWLLYLGHGLTGSERQLLDFFADRLKVQQREAGVRHDLIDAVFALGGEDDLVRLLARVHALQAFVGTPDGTNLLAGYKRAANILKKEAASSPPVIPAKAGIHRADISGEMDSGIRRNDEVVGGSAIPLSYTPEPAEKVLMDALDTAAPRAAAAVAAEDFAGAMSALASLRAPIDAFFESVTVNDADPAKRSARLALLSRFRDAVHSVADFSRIEG